MRLVLPPGLKPQRLGAMGAGDPARYLAGTFITVLGLITAGATGCLVGNAASWWASDAFGW